MLPGDEPLVEMDGEKRLWMKDTKMTFEIYSQHLKPTVFNTDMKILTTQHYVPEYLEKIVARKEGTLIKLQSI